MVTIGCPWCDEDRPLSLADFMTSEASFTCPECGTSVAIATEPEPEPVLDLAA